VYISPRTRDFTQDNVVSEKIRTVEGGYVLNAPKVKLRLTGYYTSFKDGMNVMSFYHEQYRNFINYSINNIDRVHYGGELGAEVKLTPTITMNAAAALGRYYYTSNQNATITLDNTTGILGQQTAYLKNFNISGTPQEAYSLGFTYRSPNFWSVGLTGNYFDQMWLEPNPLRRTSEAVGGIDPKSDLYHAIIDQQRFNHQFTLDFFGGYSVRLPHSLTGRKSYTLYFNAGVNNILNNKKIITGGFEQLRYDYGAANVNEFPPKLYYAYGLNYFASVSLRF
jgi:outer membrane receptor protein involved in Fe transport